MQLTSFLVTFGWLMTSCSAAMNWYQFPPDRDDLCTVIVIPSEKHALVEMGVQDGCMSGGLMWYSVTGRIHLEFSPRLTQGTEDFLFCLTGGLEGTAFFWWDSREDYWQPISFPYSLEELDWWHKCRPSTNGTFDVYVETPWSQSRYMAYASWEMTPLKPSTQRHLLQYINSRRRYNGEGEMKDFDFDLDYDEIERDQFNSNKDLSSYMLVVMDEMCGYVTVVMPFLGIIIVVASLGLKYRFVKKESELDDKTADSDDKNDKKKRKLKRKDE